MAWPSGSVNDVSSQAVSLVRRSLSHCLSASVVAGPGDWGKVGMALGRVPVLEGRLWRYLNFPPECADSRSETHTCNCPFEGTGLTAWGVPGWGAAGGPWGQLGALYLWQPHSVLRTARHSHLPRGWDWILEVVSTLSRKARVNSTPALHCPGPIQSTFIPEKRQRPSLSCLAYRADGFQRG